ncbi:preprotein translocase subunit SecE [unidentified bacterial endosymbiont]|uniref:preprotein translocase subunit SecE n=1 Tax=unidentified bacterial endosymbiont TaxID=2355 RepID=UPI0020A023F8|nr:preprotein translocase subunit SecE [unidentified bacterial endosymbiont]
MEIIQPNSFNRLKWALVFCLLGAVIVGNYYYREMALTVRSVAAVAVVSLALLLARTTQQGGAATVFIREALNEARRVIWPTRPVTLQITLVVAIMTLVAALVLWGIDTLLVMFITFITGLRV